MNKLQLYKSSNFFGIFSSLNYNPKIGIIINRKNIDILIDERDKYFDLKAEIYNIDCIIGIAKCENSFSFLILVESSIEIGSIDHNIIYSPSNYLIFEIENYISLNINNNRYVYSLLKYYLDNFKLYYSYNYNLTCPFHQSFETNSFNCYISNFNLLKPFINITNNFLINNLIPIAFPKIIEGFLQEKILNNNLKLIIISRRSIERIGARYLSRGIDQFGKTSNFIETELLIFFNNRVISYIILRGSCPIFWNQYTNLNYIPLFQIYPYSKKRFLPFKKHFEYLINRFNYLICVCLIKNTGFEGLLKNNFKNYCKNFKNPNFFAIFSDFSKIIIQKEKISAFFDDFDKYINQLSYNDPKKSLIQKGIFRINCVDSLDRTNLFQYFIIIRILKKIFDNQTFYKLEPIFKEIWINNGNQISFDYVGTLAQKKDYILYDKRTISGSIDDFIISLKRYYIAIFYDGFRHDSMTLFHSSKNVRFIKKPYNDNFFCIYIIIILILNLSWFFLIILNNPIISPNLKQKNLILCIITFFSLFFFIFLNGNLIVSKPLIIQIYS